MDRSNGNINTVPLTKGFTDCCDLIRAICRRGLNIEWTESELQNLEKSIEKFKNYSRSVFECYLVPSMETSKWHCFEYLVNS